VVDVTDPSTHFALLNLLGGRKGLIDIISAWPGVTRPEGWLTNRRVRRKMLIEWARMAKRPQFEVEDNWRMLLNNGFIDEHGGVNHNVAVFTRTAALDNVPREMRRRLTEKKPDTKPQENANGEENR